MSRRKSGALTLGERYDAVVADRNEIAAERDRLRREVEALRDHVISMAAAAPYLDASSAFQDVAADLDAILRGES